MTGLRTLQSRFSQCSHEGETPAAPCCSIGPPARGGEAAGYETQIRSEIVATGRNNHGTGRLAAEVSSRFAYQAEDLGLNQNACMLCTACKQSALSHGVSRPPDPHSRRRRDSRLGWPVLSLLNVQRSARREAPMLRHGAWAGCFGCAPLSEVARRLGAIPRSCRRRGRPAR